MIPGKDFMPLFCISVYVKSKNVIFDDSCIELSPIDSKGQSEDIELVIL